MKNTLEKIRRNARDLGLAGLIGVGSVLMTGCETPQDRLITGILLGGMAPYSASPQAGQSANFIGGAMVSSANAELSRSQVNVNVGVDGQQDSRNSEIKQEQQNEIFYNGGDGIKVFYDNSIGEVWLFSCGDIHKRDYKKTFYDGEKISVAMDVKKKILYRGFLRLRLFSEDNNLIEENYEQSNEAIKLFYFNYSPYQLKFGKYTAAFYKNADDRPDSIGRLVGKINFEIRRENEEK